MSTPGPALADFVRYLRRSDESAFSIPHFRSANGKELLKVRYRRNRETPRVKPGTLLNPSPPTAAQPELRVKGPGPQEEGTRNTHVLQPLGGGGERGWYHTWVETKASGGSLFLPLAKWREQVRRSHRADAGAARTSPGRSRKRLSLTVQRERDIYRCRWIYIYISIIRGIYITSVPASLAD